MLISSHTSRLEAVITIREVPRESALMSDGSNPPGVVDIWVGGTGLHSAPRGSVSSPNRHPAERLPNTVRQEVFQLCEEVLRVSSK